MQPHPHPRYTVSVRLRPHNPNSQISFTSFKNTFVKQFRQTSILTYSFDRVFQPHHTNEDIYNSHVGPLVRGFLENNIDTTILAYGQTGSGKTHTLFGNKEGEMGLAGYVVREVAGEGNERQLRCSFMQIYKEKPTDLITQQEIRLMDDGKGELVYQNLLVSQVKEEGEILGLLEKANKNKIVGSSYIHNESSRAHVIFRISTKKANLNIVDLCGSQLLTYQFDEKQRQETSTINLSLFTLNAVLSQLCERKTKGHIPFRNSILTRILKSSLLGPSQIYMFCNVSPEKEHQALSGSTLRFGQLAIQIDESDKPTETKVNLSQQKREDKKNPKVIEISPKPVNYYPQAVNWTTRKEVIFGNKIKLYELRAKNPAKSRNILILHAYGGNCDGRDFDYFIPELSNDPSINFFSVDFPGFGASQGKKFTSRAQNFGDKKQSLDFMVQIFKIFNFSPYNKVTLMGYDLGGAIALSCCTHRTLSKSIQSIIPFHPTWTDSPDKLSPITQPTLLIWFPVQTFHLISAGYSMLKVIKDSQMCKVVIGAYSNQKASGLYDKYVPAMLEVIKGFLERTKRVEEEEGQREGRRNRGRGVVLEEMISPSKEMREEMEQGEVREAIKECVDMIKNKTFKQLYNSIIRTDQKKPKAVKLASSIPILSPQTISWSLLQSTGLIKSPPKNALLSFSSIGNFGQGRQLQIQTLVNMSVLQGDDYYLTYKKDGELGITHKAFVAPGQNEEQMRLTSKIEVEVDCQKEGKKRIAVSLEDVVRLNCQTKFVKNVTGGLVFEDSVFCKYNSLITRLKMLECVEAIEPLIAQMDFSNNTKQLLDLQKQCTERIYRLIDLKHLVHEGIDNTRFTGTDAGRLAHYGQGNCHHLASVLAAFLLPFGKILGWEVIFRAGSYLKTGRQLDQDGEPLPKWNGKPNTKVQDHTWLELVYKPSLHMVVFDPSFSYCSVPLDIIYSRYGLMHISGRIQCNSDEPDIPLVLCNSKSLELPDRKPWSKSQKHQQLPQE